MVKKTKSKTPFSLFNYIKWFCMGVFRSFTILMDNILEIIYDSYVGFYYVVSTIAKETFYLIAFIIKNLIVVVSIPFNYQEYRGILTSTNEKPLLESLDKKDKIKAPDIFKNPSKKIMPKIVKTKPIVVPARKVKKEVFINKDFLATVNKMSEKEKSKKKFKEQLLEFYNNLSFVKTKREKEEAEKIIFQNEIKNESAIRSEKPLVYRYRARNKEGKMVNGYFNGYSRTDVNTFLVNEGYDIYIIETSPWINFVYGQSNLFNGRMSTKDLIFWITQLSTYIKAGITLTEAIRILGFQMGKRNAQRKRIFNAIVYELTMGETFSRALEKQGDIFPNLFVNMLKAAEAAGNLEETLDDMAAYYTEVDKTNKQMKTALSYPAIIIVFSNAVITFIMLFVIPQFVGIYKSMDVKMNKLTATILAISKFLQNNIYLLIIVIALIIIAIYFIYTRVKAFRTTLQKIFMKIPVFGKIIIYKELTIFTKTFASLLKNNVFITESIDILSRITKNEIYKNIMFNTIANIAKGDKISDSFKDQWAIPDVAYYMIVTGESTGELAEMMGTVSNYYQEAHRNIIDNLKALIEPVMIVGLAVIVGVIIISVIIPMFDIYKNIGL